MDEMLVLIDGIKYSSPRLSWEDLVTLFFSFRFSFMFSLQCKSYIFKVWLKNISDLMVSGVLRCLKIEEVES